jgi:hypothetical protein
MLVWALAVLHELTPSIWTALLDAIAAAPSESLDEVHWLNHLCRITQEYTMQSTFLDAVSACKGKDHCSSERLCHERKDATMHALLFSPHPVSCCR